MQDLPSSEFRRAYASLTEPTRVTVVGREIGTWWPTGTGDRYQSLVDEIVHLKRELAARPGPLDSFATALGNMGKPSTEDDARSGQMVPGRGRQKVIDEALRKVNRTTKAKP